MHINTDSSSSASSVTPPRRTRLGAALARTGPVDGAELASRLRALAHDSPDGTLAIPSSDMALARRWIEDLLERMDNMSHLTDQELADLAALKHTAATATKIAVASRSQLGRTSLVAASAMYWLSFAPGKIAANAVAAGLIASGLPQAAAWAPWTNIVLVPVIQVLFAEPVGGAYRADGQSYASPDGVAYVNYQTAHALLIRAWLEDQPDDMAKYRKIMGDIVDGVIDREAKLDDSGQRRMAIVSGATKPERDERGLARIPDADPAATVMSHARWRAFLADEVPVHTFTLLNGASGAMSLLWPGLVGAAWAKLPDAALHVLLGTVAMVWMFESQNDLRRQLQAGSVAHGSDTDILALKRAEPEQRQQMWATRKAQATSALAGLRLLRGSLKALITRSGPGDPNLAQALEQLDRIDQAERELALRLSDIRKARRRAERATQAWTSSRHRAETAVNRTLSSYAGEHDKQPVKWLDGSPVIVRNLSKLVGYMAVLAPSATQTMLLVMMLNNDMSTHAPGPATGTNNTAAHLLDWNTTHIPGNVSEAARTAGPGVASWAMASTVALTAIVGWTGRSLYAVPAFEHLFHAAIGMANRVGRKAGALCGVTAPAFASADLVLDMTGGQERNPDAEQQSATPSSRDSSSSNG